MSSTPSAFELESNDDRWLERAREARSDVLLGEVGNYELLEEVNRGGQGIVFRARDRRTGRQVALKRLHGGSLAGSSQQRRFEREIEACAQLDHPGVVRLFACERIEGQSVLSMEWIQGITVTEWCRETADLRCSVSLFLQICEAVQHAHQRGVLHRDLKPSNILVDSSGQARVLDFGLAKRLDPDSEHEATLTMSQVFVGTLAYASVEQLRGQNREIDVRSDVYSLGVIFYEMLTGDLPYHSKGGVADWLQAQEQQTPTSPSRRGAGNRELDAILQQALEQRIKQRYQTVDALAEDVRRYLSGDPVLAHPPSGWYYFTKLARRHRWPFAVAAMAFFFLAVTTVLVSVQAKNARDQRDRAVLAQQEKQAEADRADAILKFFLEQVFGQATYRPDTQERTLSEALQLAKEGVNEQLPDHPAIRSQIFDYISAVAVNLGRWNLAREAAEAALENHLLQDRAGRLRRAVLLNSLGSVLTSLDQRQGAEPLLLEALEIQRELLGPRSKAEAKTRRHLSLLKMACSDWTQAEMQAREALAILAETDANWEETLACRDALAAILQEGGEQLDEALELRQELLQTLRSRLGPTHIRTGVAYRNLGRILQLRSRPEEALKSLTQALKILQMQQPPAFSELGDVYQGLGDVVASLGRAREALEHFQKAVDLFQTYPENQVVLGNALGRVAGIKSALYHDDAETIAREAVAMLRQHDPGGRALGSALDGLGGILLNKSQLPEARSTFQESLTIMTALYGELHLLTIGGNASMARVLWQQGRHEESERIYLECIDRLSQAEQYYSPLNHDVLCNCGQLLVELKRYDEAADLLEEATELTEDLYGPESEHLCRIHVAQARALSENGDSEIAEPILRVALQNSRAYLPETHRDTTDAMLELVHCLIRLKRFDSAQDVARESLELLPDHFDEDHLERHRRRELPSWIDAQRVNRDP